MAKNVLVLILAAVVSKEIFAQTPFYSGAGVGGFAAGDFGGGNEGSSSAGEVSVKTPYFGGGGFIFVDGKNMELSVGFFSGSGKYKTTVKKKATDETSKSELDMSLTKVNVGLFYKHPFAVTKKFLIFPVLGVEYNICLSAMIDGEKYKDKSNFEMPSDFNTLWLKLGGGIDYTFNDKIYLILEVLYGIRLPNNVENEGIKNISKKYGLDLDANPLIGHGLTAKLAIGYKIKHDIKNSLDSGM